MDDIIKNLIQSQPKSLSIHIIREFLQIHTLYCLSKSKYGKNLAFLGGTALRILHNTNRYSQNLDFDLVKLERRKFQFPDLLNTVTGYFKKRNLPCSYRENSKRNVYKSMIKFHNLLFDFQLSPYKDEILSIKLEVDTHPNPESKFSSVVINKYNLLFPVLRSDLPSMMAGKICAVFKRGYRLGRDFYDLGWYLTRRIEPNYKYLEKELGIKNKQVLEERLLDLFTKIDWEKLMVEVKPFLIKKEELFLYSQLDKVLKDYIQEVA